MEATELSPTGYPRPTPEQREAMVSPHMGGGWPGYLSRLRESHRPIFKSHSGRVIYSGCSCDHLGPCPIPYLLLHIEDVLDAYDAKVAEFAAETRRVEQHRAVIQRLLRHAIPHEPVIEERRRSSDWKPWIPLDAVFLDGWAPPIEREIIRECWEADWGAYAWAVTDA